MDKNSDAKGGAARFYRRIANKSERAKKTRRLSCFNLADSPSKQDSEMGLSQTGNDSSPLSHSQTVVSRNVKSKRFPMSKRFFDGFSCVDRAPVPRRLRSAMKKRICESASTPLLDSKKQNQPLAVGGGESPEKDGIKGALLNFAGQSSPARQVDSDGFQPITKDEEEVAETLFALAGMFYDTKTAVAAELSAEFSGADAPQVPEMGTIPNPASEIKGSNDEENLKYEVLEVVCLNRTAFQEQPGIGENTTSHTATDSLDKGMLLSATAECKEENLHSLILNLSRLNQPQQQVIGQETMQEMGLGARTDESKLSGQDTAKGSGKNELTLWPSLSSALTTAGASHRPSKLADAKLLTLLGAASSASRPGSLDKTSSRKSSKAAITKKTMKRCATHVYISHLIQALKMPPEDNGSSSSEATELNLCKVLKENVFPSLKANRSNRENNEIDGTNTTSRFGNFTAQGNLCEAEAASNFVGREKLLKHRNQFLPASGSQKTKQEFDFLSLSVGSNSMEADKDRNVSGSSSHLYAPYIQSILPLSAQQTTPYMSCAHVNKSSVPVPTGQQVQLQLPLHLNSSLYSSFREKHSGISRQPQQQQFCAAQGPARSRTTGPSITLNQFPNWLQVKHDHCRTMFPSGQAIFPLHPIYMDAISTKYSTVGQHQQPLKAASSSLYTQKIDKIEERQLASLYEEGRRGFRLGSVLPLQLLCNESL